MCGVFGMLRAQSWTTERCERAAEAILMLGALAEERGTDAAGLALRGALGTASRRKPRADISRLSDVRVDGWRVTKTRGAFSDLDVSMLADDLREARVVLGHTRWSTQGGDRLVNASPLVIGPVIGTHNGDVTTSSVRSLIKGGIRVAGDTDTEMLFAAIGSTGGGMNAVRAVLETVEGRAALAWVDRRQPYGVWLARAALSPLAVAGDRQGGLWWASNPQWLRRVEQHFDLGLTAPRMLQEGTLLRVRARKGALDVQLAPLFVPLARTRDRRLADLAVWRGFTRADKDDDKAHLRHKLASEPRRSWRSTREPLWASVVAGDEAWPLPPEPEPYDWAAYDRGDVGLDDCCDWDAA